MDLVSIIIPAFNASRYLTEAVDSALSQTYREIEITVVDDGSKDDTNKIIDLYGKKINVIRQNNKGVAAACNAGVSAAKGEWISFLDADDIWLPEKLSFQIECCGDAAFSYTDSFLFGDILTREIRRSTFEPPCSGNVLKDLLIRNFITKSTVMIRRDLYLKYGGFNESYAAVEDWPFFLKVCAEHELCYVPKPLVKYRVHRKSKSMHVRKTIADHLRIINEAFSVDGLGRTFPYLKKKALENSYKINCHFAAESGDWPFAIYCALHALMYKPNNLRIWKNLIKSALIPIGIKY